MHTPMTLSRTVQVLLLAAVASVSATTLQAQSDSRATAIELQGQVYAVRGGMVALFQSHTAGATDKNSTVGAAEEIFTGPDGYARFRIADGSTFEVFPNSRVTFQAKYTLEDMLELLLGKIRVQIEHHNGPNHKKVSTPTALISVRGTVFDVAVEDPDGTTLVSVEEGQVEVRHLLQPSSITKTLNAGDAFRIYPNQPIAKAGGPPAFPVKFVMDRIKGAVYDILLNNPGGGGGLPGAGGGAPGTPGGQADGGKNKKNPPAGTPPPPPGGGI
jgi:ferric-dicitrate binding protein FerR (iron transport regulator)